MIRDSIKSNVDLKKHKSTLFVFFVCINAALSAFYVGYSLVYISTFENFATIIEIYGIRIGAVSSNKEITYFNDLHLYEKDPMILTLHGENLAI